MTDIVFSFKGSLFANAMQANTDKVAQECADECEGSCPGVEAERYQGKTCPCSLSDGEDIMVPGKKTQSLSVFLCHS